MKSSKEVQNSRSTKVQHSLLLSSCTMERGTFDVKKFNEYWSPTRIPNRDKETESPYLVHPLTYRQFYLTKDAYFGEKMHCLFVKMA